MLTVRLSDCQWDLLSKPRNAATSAVRMGPSIVPGRQLSKQQTYPKLRTMAASRSVRQRNFQRPLLFPEHREATD
jgi:hypothetical protein